MWHRKAHHGGRSRRVLGLAPRGVNNINMCHRAAPKNAVEAPPPSLRRNPASKAFKYSRKGRLEMKTWTTEEVQRFLDFTAHDIDAALYLTAALTGMRRGE